MTDDRRLETVTLKTPLLNINHEGDYVTLGYHDKGNIIPILSMHVDDAEKVAEAMLLHVAKIRGKA